MRALVIAQVGPSALTVTCSGWIGDDAGADDIPPAMVAAGAAAGGDPPVFSLSMSATRCMSFSRS